MSKLDEFIEEKATERFVGVKYHGRYVHEKDLRELGKTHVMMEKELLLACYEWALDAQSKAKELAKINEPYPLRQQRYNAVLLECSQNVEKLKAMIQASEPEMIEHNCSVNGEMMIEKGKPCNWCG